MKYVLFLLVIIATFIATSPAVAGYRSSDDSYQGFVKIRPERELYVDLVKAKRGQPTIVVLNGLTYSTHEWQRMVEPLLEKGVGVLLYDMRGMGETLLKYAPVMDVIPYQDQIEDLKLLLQELQMEAPYNFVGLSYGGGLAMAFAAAYPELVKKMILMAPYMSPLEGQDTWIKSQIWYTRKIYPYNPATDDELYDYFLKQIVYSTYPTAEPSVMDNPYKLEAVYRMTQGVRKFDAHKVVDRFPRASVHMMIAAKDQYIARNLHDEFWDMIPRRARASRIWINDSEHKIPEAVPNFAAGWIYEIVSQNKKLSGGASFTGFPFKGEARSEDGGVIALPKD